MLELKKEMCKHLAEDSFNADDADACLNVWVMLQEDKCVYLYTVPLSSPNLIHWLKSTDLQLKSAKTNNKIRTISVQ